MQGGFLGALLRNGPVKIRSIAAEDPPGGASESERSVRKLEIVTLKMRLPSSGTQCF